MSVNQNTLGVHLDTIPTGSYDIVVYMNPAGGRTYYSTELGQVIWDTCLDDKELLDVVLALEAIYSRTQPSVAQQAEAGD